MSFPIGGDPFFAEIQEVYDEIGEGLPADHVYVAPGGLPDQRDDIEASGLFEVTEVRHFDWETTYDADGYLALLDTFSGHIAMEAAARRALVRRDPPAPGPAARRSAAATLGCRPARGPRALLTEHADYAGRHAFLALSGPSPAVRRPVRRWPSTTPRPTRW